MMNGKSKRVARTADVSKKPIGIVLILVIASLVSTLFATMAVQSHSVEMYGHRVFIFSSLVALVTVVYCRRARSVTAGVLLLVLTLLFHGGIIYLQAFGVEVSGFNAGDGVWINQGALALPAAVAAVGVSAYSAGYSVVYLIGSVTESTVDQQNIRWSSQTTRTAATILGMAILAGGVLGWYAVLLGAGVSPFGSSYVVLLETVTFPYIQYFYLAIGLGLSVVTASGRRASLWFALPLFLAFAIPGFLIGLRGEVLIPVASALVVASRRGVVVPLWQVFLGLAASLWAGSIIRVSRLGSSGVADALTETPWDGLIETGYSIRPLYEILTSPSVTNDTTGFATYLAPVRRVFEGRLLGLDVIPIQADPVVYWTAVTQHIGPIGGSFIAESFLSGRLVGVLIVLTLIGVVTALIDATKSSVVTDVLVGGISLILFQWVRGDFTPVPVSLMIVVSAAIAIAITSRHAAHTAYPGGKSAIHRVSGGMS